MARAFLILANDQFRQRAVNWIMSAPKDTRVELKGPKRTLPQNDRMWAMLTDLSVQLPWHGLKLTPDDWKLVMLDALKRANSERLRLVPNTDGTGFVNLSTSSSDLDKGEMADLIELMFEFGSRHGIAWSDPALLGERAA